MNRIQQFLQHQPLFLLLLPVFFVLHGFNENFHSALANASLILALKYIGIAMALTALAWLLFRDLFKAALFSFFLLCIYFFFGSAHDFLKTYFTNSFLSRYSFILPAIFVFLVLLVFYLKKNEEDALPVWILSQCSFPAVDCCRYIRFLQPAKPGKPRVHGEPRQYVEA